MIVDSFLFALKLVRVAVSAVGLPWPRSPCEPGATAARPLLAVAAAPLSAHRAEVGNARLHGTRLGTPPARL